MRLLSLVLVVLAVACAPESGTVAPPPDAGLSLAEVLGGDPGDFRRALEPREFRFPADHGPHEDFRSEWWYVTGNLSSRTGHGFAYHLTFFRSAVEMSAQPRASAWSTDQIYMGHFAVADLDGGTFRSAERFSRAALGLAGARATPFVVWIDDWSMQWAGDKGDVFHGPAGAEGVTPLRLRAASEGAAIDLTLNPVKPIVLHGDGGLSRKGSQPGNASYYYSLPRLRVEGTVIVDGVAHTMSGTSWLDREWSSSALEPGQTGWDWFSLQLDDEELMLYQLRRDDGSVDPSSSGTWIDAAGKATHLSSDAFSIEVLDHWSSSRTGVRYPAAWRLTVPGQDAVLRLFPRLADQELDHVFRYWEGAVLAEGELGGRPVSGVGFVELTGYR